MNQSKQQAQAIFAKLCEYERTTHSLTALLETTNAIDQLLRQLELKRSPWIDRLRTEWWELEWLTSVMLDQNETVFSNEDIAVIEKAIANMKKMIIEKYGTN